MGKYSFGNFKAALTLVNSENLLPDQEIRAILKDANLQAAASIILNAPIDIKYKLKVLYNDKLREEAVLILKSFLSTKMKQRAFKNPKFWYDTIIVLKSSLLEADKKKILFEKNLRKYSRYLTVSKEDILKARALIGLDDISKVAKHILLYDPSGRTEGCGCKLCIYKNKEYKNSKFLTSYRRGADSLDKIKILFEGDGSKKTPLADPFECQYFENMNATYIKGFKNESFRDTAFSKDAVFLEKSMPANRRIIVLSKAKAPVRKLKGGEGRKIVLERLERERNALHSKIQVYFGKENSLRNTRTKLIELMFLPH